MLLAGIVVVAMAVRIDDAPFEARGEVGDGAHVYLFVGADAGIERDPADPQYRPPGEQEGVRADVVVLVRVSGAGAVDAVSVPRDLLVERPYEGPTRLSLTLLDGPQAVVDGVCAGLGVTVDRFVSIDTGAFTSAVDALGGVSVDVPTPLRDPAAELDLPTAGPQTLDGAEALALVRSRHAEQLTGGEWTPTADGPEDRTRWAGVVLDGVRERLAGAGPLTLARTSWAASDGLALGGGLHPGELRRLAAGGLEVRDLPVDPTGGELSVRAGDEAMRTLEEAGFATDCPLRDEQAADDGSSFGPADG